MLLLVSNPRLDDQLCFALYAASRAVISAQRPGLCELGLTYPQYLVMLVLWEEGEVAIGRLCRRLYLDSGTVSPLVRRLEVSGLVERRRSAADERSTVVALTEEGAAMADRSECVSAALGDAIADASADSPAQSRFTAADVESLRGALHDLIGELDRIESPQNPTATS